MWARRVLWSLCIFLPACFARAADDVRISAGLRNEPGVLVHTVESPYQSAPTKIRVLLPDVIAPGETYPIIYVLPVEALDEHRYGDGLTEIKSQGLHNKQRAIFVAPTFAQLPWYADHPSDLGVRQESHLLRVVVPYIDQNYPTANKPSGRLLLGFSKSGWGAWSLLLRHPETFGRAAAWDAPLMMPALGKFGSAAIFGTAANFADYQVTTRLRASQQLQSEKRLILTGFGGFRSDHQAMHALLEELRIPHAYRDGPERRHDWHSGWVAEAVQLLVSPAGGHAE